MKRDRENIKRFSSYFFFVKNYVKTKMTFKIFFFFLRRRIRRAIICLCKIIKIFILYLKIANKLFLNFCLI